MPQTVRAVIARVPWTFVAIGLAIGSFVTYAVALSIGPGCADGIALPVFGVFVASMLWVAYLQEKKKGTRR